MSVVEIKNICKEYIKGTAVCDEINLKINHGDFVSIVGRSGTGKTTLIKMLIGEEKPTSGSIKVLDWDLTKIKKRQLSLFRRQVGVVFQDFKLLKDKTIFENVAFAMMVSGKSRKEINEVVPQILELVGLQGKDHRFPHELSGGEQQRTAIARAFVNRPKLLIADEMTGDLDVLYAWEILEILQKINSLGTTVILATHDRDIVNKVNKRVVTMEDGKIIRDQLKGDYLL